MDEWWDGGFDLHFLSLWMVSINFSYASSPFANHFRGKILFLNFGPSCLKLLSAGIIGLCHHTQSIDARYGTDPVMLAKWALYQWSYTPTPLPTLKSSRCFTIISGVGFCKKNSASGLLWCFFFLWGGGWFCFFVVVVVCLVFFFSCFGDRKTLLPNPKTQILTMLVL